MLTQTRRAEAGFAWRHVRLGKPRPGLLPGAIALLVAVGWVAACENPVVPVDLIDPVDRDRAALYEATDGEKWPNRIRKNWLSEAPLEDWYGVSVGSGGRVEALDLSRGHLTGSIPPELGELSSLRWLRLHNSDLKGTLPATLTNLELDTFHAHGTALCAPRGSAFQEWLEAIADRQVAVCEG